MPIDIEEMMRDLEAADAAGDTELARAIAARIKAAQQGAAPAPAAPAAPAPRGATPAPVPAPVGGGVAAPAPAPAAPAAPAPRGATPEPEFDPTAGMTWPELGAAGVGQSLVSTGRGARQIWNYLTGDKEELARLNAEENESRKADAALLATGAGRLGQVGGHILQALIPGAGVAKLAGAARLGTAGIVGAESAMGGALGGLQPTVDGESRAGNVKTGATIGAVLPFGGAGLRAAGNIALSPVRGAIGMVTPRGLGPMADILSRAVRSTNSPAKQEAGQLIGQISEKARVRMTPALISKLKAVRAGYADSLPADVTRQIDDWARLAESGKLTVKGKTIQDIRSAIGKEAYDGGGMASTGLKRLQTILDDATDASLPKADVRVLRRARQQYNTGTRSPFNMVPRPAPGNGTVDRLKYALTSPEAHRAAGRGALQSVLTAWRSALEEEN